MGGVATCRDVGRVVAEAGPPEAVVAVPMVGVDDRAGFGHPVYEVGTDDLRAVGDASKPDAAQGPAWQGFDGDGRNRLAQQAASGLAPFRAAEVALVDLELASELVASGPHHRAAQLVQDHPARLVAAQP